MRPSARTLVLAAAVVLACGSGGTQTRPAGVGPTLPSATLAGSSQFTYWGFQVYNASLWVAPGFRPQEYERHGFALELEYLRDFSNADITRRSIEEMRRLGTPPAQLAAWQTALQDAFPDVRRGDRITGIHQPGQGTTFMTNGQKTGAIDDPEFARMFFGIWLSPRTSEPRMRQALLARIPAA